MTQRYSLVHLISRRENYNSQHILYKTMDKLHISQHNIANKTIDKLQRHTVTAIPIYLTKEIISHFHYNILEEAQFNKFR